ncbi:proton-conducting transporter transmembrane domain-containing protein [Fulvivirga lutea]|uniref:Probable inorganic carbon transporter subunit DabB n=1 Tax=Fulvivirga lutea TaxID=2810512 RepID=A0A974WL52_9BACT|nr:proton-conducting transporter membrane subunit [Fulvivirga lutea]QSE98210.1 NADH/ubiquinone/plastoquinone (complex i) [Fulvivirga lutea]
MQTNLISLFPALAPLILYALSLILLLKVAKPKRGVIESFGWLGIVIAVTSACLTWYLGTTQSVLLGFSDLGFSLRLDALSMTLFVMIALLAFVILKFSINYLDGDSRHHIFVSRLAATIASVELLVLSGNLFQLFIFWIITSVCLHYLLTFYRTRPQAIAAARKKYIVARIGDICLGIAFALIFFQFGTGDLQSIFDQLATFTTLNSTLTTAAVLLVIAAVLKSAQFPTHGWLIEVVETPTPVSALLHAGLLNAGPFLMVRFAFLMQLSEAASLVLIIIAGFTALFASVVYLTQPTIKVSLGYSSVAHMGFSLLMCGFGVYSAAILHLVAHSFYKANSFLSSGSVVEVVKAKKVVTPNRLGSIPRILLGVIFSLGIYALFCYWWGLDPVNEFSLMAVGAIIALGVSQLIVTTIDSKGSLSAILQSGVMVFIVSLAFFSLEKGAHVLLASQVPVYTAPSLLIKGVIITTLVLFGSVVFIQLISPALKSGSFGYRLGVHLRNGLYANVIFDRMIGALKNDKFKWANLTVEAEENNEGVNEYAQENGELIYKSQTISNQ